MSRQRVTNDACCCCCCYERSCYGGPTTGMMRKKWEAPPGCAYYGVVPTIYGVVLPPTISLVWPLSTRMCLESSLRIYHHQTRMDSAGSFPWGQAAKNILNPNNIVAHEQPPTLYVQRNELHRSSVLNNPTQPNNFSGQYYNRVTYTSCAKRLNQSINYKE